MKPREQEVLPESPDAVRDEVRKMALTVGRRAATTGEVAAYDAAEALQAEAEAEDLEAARRAWATLEWLR